MADNKQTENKTAGASYILNFYKDILVLTDYYSQYLNLLLEVESKYKNIEAAEEEERQTIKNGIQNLRHYCTKVFVQYRSISLSLKLPFNEVIEDSYKNIKTIFVLNRVDLEAFVIQLNNLLVQNIIHELIDNSDNILREAFN